MDRTAIEAITNLSEPHFMNYNGFRYSDKSLSVVNVLKIPCIPFATLNGMLDVLADEIDKLISPEEKLIIHITNADSVDVISPIVKADNSRPVIYRANANLPNYTFSRYLDYESMVISLKSKFVDNEDLNTLVQLMGTITTENAATVADDGFTQTVTVKKGVVMKENRAINPYFKLKPYRTFIECEQPESIFLLRIRDGSAALFEADGGAWELEARRNVKKYVTNYLKGISETAFDKVLIVE